MVRASFSTVTLDVSALTMEVSPMLGAEAMADEGSGELASGRGCVGMSLMEAADELKLG